MKVAAVAGIILCTADVGAGAGFMLGGLGLVVESGCAVGGMLRALEEDEISLDVDAV